ncbi:UNVERIFIED_CONTAM: hypothetical protein K2H54_056140 [Gekko kuhli]
MRDSFFSIEPKSLLAMRAVGELRIQTLISRDLRTSIVAWALGLVFGGSPAGHEEAGGQGLWQEGEEGLHPMLLAFLREDPSAGSFFTLLDLSAWERCRRAPPPPPLAAVGPHDGSLAFSSIRAACLSPGDKTRPKSLQPGARRAAHPREPVQSPLGFSGPLEILAVLLVDSTP